MFLCLLLCFVLTLDMLPLPLVFFPGVVLGHFTSKLLPHPISGVNEAIPCGALRVPPLQACGAGVLVEPSFFSQKPFRVQVHSLL